MIYCYCIAGWFFCDIQSGNREERIDDNNMVFS